MFTGLFKKAIHNSNSLNKIKSYSSSPKRPMSSTKNSQENSNLQNSNIRQTKEITSLEDAVVQINSIFKGDSHISPIVTYSDTQMKKLRMPIKELNQLWYRGQKDASWLIQPSIFRNQASELEPKFMDEHNAIFHLISSHPELKKNCLFDILCIAQHHSLPTRLIDWTRALNTALFFASKGPDDVDGELFVLNPYKLNFYAFGKTGILHPDHPEVALRMRLATSKSFNDFYSGISAKMLDEAMGTRKFDPEEYLGKILSRGEDEELWNRIRLLSLPVASFATMGNERIIAQQGAFTVHGGKLYKSIDYVDKVDRLPSPVNIVYFQQKIRDIYFERDGDSCNFLTSFKIPKKYKYEIRRSLEVLGAHDGIFFPELEPQAKFIKEIWTSSEKVTIEKNKNNKNQTVNIKKDGGVNFDVFFKYIKNDPKADIDFGGDKVNLNGKELKEEDINTLLNDTDRCGCSLLFHAASFGNKQALENIIDQYKKKNLSLLLLNVINKESNGGLTPLMASVLYGHYEIAQKLIENGANVNVVDRKSDTILHFLIRKVSIDKLSLIENEKFNKAEYDEKIVKRVIPLIKLMMKNGFDTKRANFLNKTPLHLACALGADEWIVKEFIKKYPNLNFSDEEFGRTPMQQCIAHCQQEMLDYLITVHKTVNDYKDSNLESLVSEKKELADKELGSKIFVIPRVDLNIDHANINNRTALDVILSCKNSDSEEFKNLSENMYNSIQNLRPTLINTEGFSVQSLNSVLKKISSYLEGKHLNEEDVIRLIQEPIVKELDDRIEGHPQYIQNESKKEYIDKENDVKNERLKYNKLELCKLIKEKYGFWLFDSQNSQEFISNKGIDYLTSYEEVRNEIKKIILNSEEFLVKILNDNKLKTKELESFGNYIVNNINYFRKTDILNCFARIYCGEKLKIEKPQEYKIQECWDILKILLNKRNIDFLSEKPLEKICFFYAFLQDMKELLEHYVCALSLLEKPDKFGFTIVDYAVRLDRADVIVNIAKISKRALRKFSGFDFPGQTRITDPMYEIAFYGKLASLTELIKPEYSSNVFFQRKKDNWSPLLVAVWGMKIEIVKRIINSCSCSPCKGTCEYKKKLVSLSTTKKMNSLNIAIDNYFLIKWLYKLPSEKKKKLKNDCNKIFDIILEHVNVCNLEDTNESIGSFLHQSARLDADYCIESILEKILQTNKAVDIVNEFLFMKKKDTHATPFHLAIYYNSENSLAVLLSFLIKNSTSENSEKNFKKLFELETKDRKKIIDIDKTDDKKSLFLKVLGEISKNSKNEEFTKKCKKLESIYKLRNSGIEDPLPFDDIFFGSPNPNFFNTGHDFKR